MGLDMYLNRRYRVAAPSTQPGDQEFQGLTVVVDKEKYPNFVVGNVVSIDERVATWRNAWVIHGWLVRNLDGDAAGNDTWVSPETLLDLLGVVTEAMENKQRAQTLLPVDGGDRMDEQEERWYFESLQYTKEALTALDLGGTGSGYCDYYYHASW